MYRSPFPTKPDSTQVTMTQSEAPKRIFKTKKISLGDSARFFVSFYITIHTCSSHLIRHSPTRIGSHIGHFHCPQPCNFSMSSQRHVRWRVSILLFSLLSLSIAVLDSVNAQFSVILRGRVTADFTSGSDGILDFAFEKLQTNIIIGSSSTAVATAGYFMIGILFSANPKWLQKHDTGFIFCSVMLTIYLTCMGVYLAHSVHGYETSFTKFSSGDTIPYYSIIYYGNIAIAGFGPFLVVAFFMVLLIQWVIFQMTTC